MNIIKVNEIKTMSSLEIAELTGKRHDHVMTDIRKMLEELGKAAPEFTGTVEYEVNNGAKRSREIFNLPKDLTITLVSRYSYVASNIIINRWLELEDAVAKISNNSSQGVEDILMLNAIADSLRVADSGKLGMLKTYCAKNAPRLLPCLPQYTVDTFKEGGSSSEATLPLTSLLDGTGISTVKANAILLKEGILEELARPSSKGGVKKFKSVTAKGLDYGKNMTSPINPRETQPHWYVNKKQELLAIITKNS